MKSAFGLVLLTVALSTLAKLPAAEGSRPPNVIVFLVDDMGWMDCGAYGAKYYETLNIDRFAKRAMRFTNAYAQPLCSPTRASLLTGKSPARHGITTPSGHLPPQPATYPRPNPAFKPTATESDPLEGWKARVGNAVVKDGVLTMTGTGKAGTAFLGHAMSKSTGPAKLSFRVRSTTGGAGKAEWLPNGAGDNTGSQSVPFDLLAGDWRELTVDVPTTGPLGVMRLYLPAHDKPTEVDWIELTSKSAKPQRWNFDAK